MIQANELRIGNLLRLNNPEHRPDEHGKVLKVVGVTEEYPLVQLVHDPNRIMSFGQFWHFIDPIPLDESWLRRAGFEKRGMFWKHPKFMLVQVWKHPEAEGFSMGVKGDTLIWKPGHVHVLQNTVFGIYGTELEFTDK